MNSSVTVQLNCAAKVEECAKYSHLTMKPLFQGIASEGKKYILLLLKPYVTQ